MTLVDNLTTKLNLALVYYKSVFQGTFKIASQKPFGLLLADSQPDYFVNF